MEEGTVKSISFVVPVYNERDTLADLMKGISDNVQGIAEDFEVVFVDDGSTDGSGEVMEELCRNDTHARAILLAVNYGKAEALGAGFEHARGDIVITMDADLQDDPVEIPAFVAKIKEGHDLVSGWKVKRHDPWHKTLPSRLFNFVVSRTFSLPLHDFNCGYKAYRKEILERINLYGELHRFIPVMAKNRGARIAEIPVRHNPRRFGKSKYGIDRLLKGFLDMTTVLVTTRYLKRPLHFFGTIGLSALALGGLMLTYLAGLWVCGVRPIGNRPLLFYGILLAILGVQVFSLGMLAELFVNYNQRREGPSIRSRIGFDEA